MIDLYAHRELLRKGALNKLDAGEIDQAKKMFAELSRLPTRKNFSMKLAEEKKKLDTKDPVVQAKINRLFSEIQKLVDRCLDDKPVEELADNLRDAKQGIVKKAESEEQ